MRAVQNAFPWKKPVLGHLHDPGFEPIQCLRYDDLAYTAQSGKT